MLQPRCAAAALHRCSGSTEPGINSLRKVRIRPIGPGDKRRLLRFFEELSPTSIALRFHGSKKTLSEEELSYFTEVDSNRHVAIMATTGMGRRARIIGTARYIRPIDGGEVANRAEVAVTVADEFQGRGVGGMLICRLTRLAKQNDVDYFVFHVSGENRRVLAMIKRNLRIVSQTTSAGAVDIVCALDGSSYDLTRVKSKGNAELPS